MALGNVSRPSLMPKQGQEPATLPTAWPMHASGPGPAQHLPSACLWSPTGAMLQRISTVPGPPPLALLTCRHTHPPYIAHLHAWQHDAGRLQGRPTGGHVQHHRAAMVNHDLRQ